MPKSRMFDKNFTKKHIGTDIAFRNRLKNLEEVEDYFLSKCESVGIDYSFDCMADENTYFKTINYTTYAGMFIMHPLSLSLQIFQMYDAKADNLASAGHVEWVERNLKEGVASKYVTKTGDEFSIKQHDPYTSVMVLAGSNKVFEHTSKVKLERLTRKLGSKLILKPHPITDDKTLREIIKNKGDAQIADKHEDVYSIIKKSDNVYTTHISETALTGLILGKKVFPMDPFRKRLVGSFFHINHFCFSETNPLDVVSSIFASPKSGVVHPDVDSDWKGKIDSYFDYIMTQRKIQKSYYYE